MKEYIDKSKVVAEINELDALNIFSDTTYKYNEDYKCGYEDALESVRKFINTLEVKEIQEEPVNEDLEEAAKNHAVERYRVTRDRELAEKCKWSFKTGAKWQKHLTDSLEVKEVDLEEEIILWANAIPEIRLDDVERLAKYFFELGLKAQKGE